MKPQDNLFKFSQVSFKMMRIKPQKIYLRKNQGYNFQSEIKISKKTQKINKMIQKIIELYQNNMKRKNNPRKKDLF